MFKGKLRIKKYFTKILYKLKDAICVVILFIKNSNFLSKIIHLSVWSSGAINRVFDFSNSIWYCYSRPYGIIILFLKQKT